MMCVRAIIRICRARRKSRAPRVSPDHVYNMCVQNIPRLSYINVSRPLVYIINRNGDILFIRIDVIFLKKKKKNVHKNIEISTLTIKF